MKTRLPFVLVLLATGCASEENQVLPTTSTVGGTSSTASPSKEAARRSNALVRFVQAMPDGGALDVYANDMRAFEGVASGAVTQYRELPKDSYKFHLRPAGQGVRRAGEDESHDRRHDQQCTAQHEQGPRPNARDCARKCG